MHLVPASPPRGGVRFSGCPPPPCGGGHLQVMVYVRICKHMFHMHIYIYIYIYILICIQLHRILGICMRMNKYKHISYHKLCTCIHMHTYDCIYILMPRHAYACMCRHMYTYAHMCIRMKAYVYQCRYIYIYISYTHAFLPWGGTRRMAHSLSSI